MRSYPPINRRMAVADLGRAGLAIMLFGLTACADERSSGSSQPNSTTGGRGAPATTGSIASQPSPEETTTPQDPKAHTSWHRAALHGVSAYVLFRGGEGVLVDTGNPGDEGAIGSALGEVGLGWESIGQVIVTHKHRDHSGSAEAIAGLAPEATFYAGAADIPSIAMEVPPIAVGDGDSVFDLDIVETPGHTPGHISIHDPAAGILVAGDSMNGAGSGVQGSENGLAGANPRFTESMGEANQSVIKLAGLSFEVILFGHGEPLLQGGAVAVEDLAATLAG